MWPTDPDQIIACTGVLTLIVAAKDVRSDALDDPDPSWPRELNMTLRVRDHARNAYDALQLNADLRFFKRDGSRLVVSPKPANQWTENLGQRAPQRQYDRLDAQQDPGQAEIESSSTQGQPDD